MWKQTKKYKKNKTYIGDAVVQLRLAVIDPTSRFYGGFVSGYGDSSNGLKWCVIGFEDCDPTNDDFNVLIVLAICFGGSFVFEIVVILIYRIATKKQRQEKYEEKVKRVRDAQLQLMEHHQKARRVGMRDVSKGRARQISNARRKQEEEDKKQRKELGFFYFFFFFFYFL